MGNNPARLLIRLHCQSLARFFFVLTLFLVVNLMVQANSTVHSQTSPTGTPDDLIVNPVVPQRADPWVYLHSDGYYYFTASVPEYDRIEIRRATTIEGLGSAEAVVVWRKRDSGIMSQNIWAAEIHAINGKWYVYYAAARVGAPFDHRIYVLENDSANPLEGTWVEKGQLRTNWESFSLDATVFDHNGVWYLVWAQRDFNIPGNSNLYIAALSDPWTISGKQVMLTKPEYPWEVIGFLVNEGPAVLKRNGRIFLTYSASATDFHYAMGILTAADTSDVLDPASWSKSPDPIFQTSDTTGQYGPGHNSFTVSPDGNDILIYHARNYKDIVGDPLYDPNRHTRAQRIYWNSDATPNFGIPVPDGPLPSRFAAFGATANFIRHDGARIVVDSDMTSVASSQFKSVPGLADGSAISFESVDVPGSYLRHRDGEIWLDAKDDSPAFAADATWQQQPGLADTSGVSFESFNMAGQYLLWRDNILWLSPVSDDAAKATFIEER